MCKLFVDDFDYGGGGGGDMFLLDSLNIY